MTPTNTVERVARAIAAASLDKDELPISDDLLRVAYVPLARAAIEAMHGEPTDKMKMAACTMHEALAFSDVRDIWNAMLDAALEEKLK